MNEILALILSLEMQHMVRVEAINAGIDPLIAECICRAENNGNPLAVGDNGRAVGLFQFHLPAWREARRGMGLDERDERTNAVASIRAALFMFKARKGYLWTTWRACNSSDDVLQ